VNQPSVDATARALLASAGLDEAEILRSHHAAAQRSSFRDDFVRQAQAEDYDETRAQFPDTDIHLEDGTVPYVRAASADGQWEVRFFVPATLELHHGGTLTDCFSLHDDATVPVHALALVTIADLHTCLTWWTRTRQAGNRAAATIVADPSPPRS
jgi:hypothetical protein